MIKDVQVKRLKVIPDERGRLMEMLRSDDPFFKKFGRALASAMVVPPLSEDRHASPVRLET